MTDKEIKKRLEDFDLDTLNCIERLDYNRFRFDYPKRLSLLKVIHRNNDNLSYGLEEISELIKGNEKDIELINK
jgi:hypothetical protein